MADISTPGKLSYMQIPAKDTAALGAFYAAVFGWSISPGTPDHVSFQDAAGELLGAFVTQWEPAAPGILPYISVDDVEAKLAQIVANGGAIDTAPYQEGNLTVARFRDPAGNTVGIWKM